MRATRLTVPALGASLVLLLGACGDDGPTRADDPAADSSASETPSQTPEASTEPVVLIDFGDEPAIEASYKDAALQAADDELITMVPSTLPDGWTTAGGGYQAEPQWWHMEYTAPTGAVTLDQFPGDTDAVLGDQGLASSGEVDLSAWGIGTWSAWDKDGAAVLTHELKGSTVVLQGADQDTVSDLAKSLLPAEDAPAQEG
ncbi:hypothetical protein EUA06_09340 [Nocardioides glacieisoli]|uniref:DUF4245 domain-containing protein n=1 Tax=Nocardioides glacieisoli TaxID=1168730 RepID=A0A4Q2RUI7_9ACTN|nr:hypothetical protein [Nocardioides glacieisoli]RYB91515.1 hypothetical protein EUA06_09340 [Nocardioides glacieisoli]